MYRWRALESIWERLVRAVKEGSKRPSKSLKGYKLRRTSNLTFLLLEMRSQITYQKTVIAFVLENHTIRDKYSQKILLHIQNKSNYIYLWWKEKRMNEATTMQRNRSAHTAWKTTFFKLTGALFSWGHVFFFRLSDEKCHKNSFY